jgi:UDP-N-acetylglucosamine 2-epimerase
MKIATIVGARPQFIKAAAVSRAIREFNSINDEQQILEVIIHTGQHYDNNMSRVFFDELKIPLPDYNLGIGSGSHGFQTGRMLEATEKILLTEQPDWVLVYGDTNSTLAGSLAAAKLHIPVAHVEAGLRSYNRNMPEEINRVLTDHLSELLFCPTEASVHNLNSEGITKQGIHLVGDVMYDAALFYQDKAQQVSRVLEQLDLNKQDFILATIHRAENTDDPVRLSSIFQGLNLVAREIPVTVPLHPRTRNLLQKDNMLTGLSENIQIIDPVSYFDMSMLEKNARLIVTDSGGVQKEAFFYRVPCVTLRDETEWVELVDWGWNQLLEPSSPSFICKRIKYALSDNREKRNPDNAYGGGQASAAIVSILRNFA